MLPDFSRLSLKPTGLFYALTQPEADELNADGGQDPISLDKYTANQNRDSDEATFRVRVDLPNNQSAWETFIAEGLWNWVKNPAPQTDPPVAKLPSSRQPIWREDWWALSDRYAPGVPYPHWVRNLPLSDPSVPDTKTYAPAAGLQHILNLTAELEEDWSLESDANLFLARAINWEAGETTLLQANSLRGSIENLLRGFENSNYADRLDQPDFSALATALGTKLLMLLAGDAPENPDRLLADAQLKGYVLVLLAKLAHNSAIQPLIRAEPNLPARLDTFQDTVLDDDFNWGMVPNDFGWHLVETRLRMFRASLLEVRHAYYWDSQVGTLLLQPAPGAMTIRALNRPLTVAEMRVLDDIATAQEGVSRSLEALEEYGARQFFATNGGGACFQLLTDLKDKFSAAADFPNSITTRNLALKQLILVINAYSTMKLDNSWQEDHATAARALLRAFDQSLEAAVTAGRVNRTVRPTPEDIGTHIEEFFWRVAAPQYVEVSESPSEVRTVERSFYSLVLLPNWPNRPPLAGDPTSDDEEEEEEAEDDDDNDDDDEDEEAEDDDDEEEEEEEEIPEEEYFVYDEVTSGPDFLREEADEAEPRPGTPLPPSPAPEPRYNLRSRSSRSGLTPNPRRQRR